MAEPTMREILTSCLRVTRATSRTDVADMIAVLNATQWDLEKAVSRADADEAALLQRERERIAEALVERATKLDAAFEPGTAMELKDAAKALREGRL